MRLPPSIRLRVVDRSDSPVADLIFSMYLSTGQRNPYHIAFPKTDLNGVAELSAADIQGQFDDCIQEDLMGHYGNLADADQTGVFALFDVEQLRRNQVQVLDWPLMTHESTKWPSREARVSYMLSARNALFRFRDEPVMINASGEVRLSVERRDEA